MALTLYRRFRVPIFWTLLAVIYGLALLPSDHAPTFNLGDKADHMTAFFVLTLVARCAFPVRPGWLVGISLSLFGAFIELSQAMPFIGRDASVWDWVADSIAIFAALLLARALEQRRPVLFVS